ncbi:DNA polymerase III subunit gamma/tau [Vibrio sp.]|uniref:DNA polymerase III subunit gamma/tau n=1 Tax=Vibrio sp. TaxID=678 RepID=UPI003D14E21F
MTYLALARKWRPNKFDQVVGQSHVLTALENALAQNRLHHAYLFSGTRGVGKTTIGRLFAKGLNCETGITATPCGQCSTCQEIDQGRFVDLLEIDAASRTKVEDTRDLLDNVQYKPARGRFKVYLIDEVHMLSRHSFNALLKTLEEPPEYVKFLLATTDPQKLPVTILSRCLQFHLKPITVDAIHQQLDYILQQEQVTSEPRALGMLAHAADGSMRDALSLADQAIALGNGQIETEAVAHMLGTLDTDQAIELLEAISSKQCQRALDAVNQFALNGVDWDGLLQQLASQLHRIALYQALPSTLDKSLPDSEKIEQLARVLTPQDVQLTYQIALKSRQDLSLAPNERTGLEMAVLRMMAFRPVTPELNIISTETAKTPVAAPQVSAPQQLSAQPARQTPQAVSSEQPAATTPSQPAPAAQEPRQPAQSYPQSSAEPEPLAEDDAIDPSYQQYLESQTAEREPEVNNQPPQPQAGSDSKPGSAPKLSGLRHQLRSQRKNLDNQGGRGDSTKKTNATAKEQESVLDRIAKKQGSSTSLSPGSAHFANATATEEKPAEQEPYQWRPSQPVEQTAEPQLAPALLKKSIEHDKTPEMAQQLVEESVVQDPWSALIQRLETPKLVEQLALNSVYERSGDTVTLTLREAHAHLHSDNAQQALNQAINQALGEQCHLNIQLGEQGETPLELRERLYQQKLQQAHTSLDADPNVKFIQQRFAAELDRESVRPI